MKSKILLSALILLLTLIGCQSPANAQSKKGMIKVTIMYANEEGKTFDMDYYAQQHMPLVAELLGDALKSYAIDKGVGGRAPDEPIPYLAIGYLYFDQLSDYQEAFGPVAEQILNDIPNYTDIQPTVQVSEVIK